jgi:hypothetical protein
MTRREPKIADANVPGVVLDPDNPGRSLLVCVRRGFIKWIFRASHDPAANDFEVIWGPLAWR